MSRLILNGDVTLNLGRYLPCPHMDKITLNNSGSGASYTLKISLIAPNNDQSSVYDNESGKILTEGDAVRQNLRDLNYYVMSFFVDQANYDTPNLEDDEDGAYNGRLPIKYFDQIVNGELNPFHFFESISPTLPATSGYDVAMTQVYPLARPLEPIFDENGNLFSKFSMNKTFVKPSITEGWDDFGDLKFIFFSSTYDYSSESTSIDQQISNIPFFNLQVSDISYETVFENGRLGNPENAVFEDSNQVIYQETPIMSFDAVPYKIGTITNENVVSSISELLQDFNVFYNRESGYEQLKNMIDNINNILSTRAQDPGLLVYLFRLMKAFPVKTPARPIGQLYKRFRQRIVASNNIVKKSERLFRKIVYDSKIFDERPLPVFDSFEPLFIEGNQTRQVTFYSLTNGTHDNEGFLYNSWAPKVYANEEMNEFNIDVFFAMCYFDYEKALKRTSNISKIFDVQKLEDWGIFVPWKSFSTVFMEASRQMTVDEDEYDAFNSKASIASTFDTNQGYPFSDTIYLSEINTYPESGRSNPPTIGNRTLFTTPTEIRGLDEVGETDVEMLVGPYTSPEPGTGIQRTVSYDAENGAYSSFVFRQFLDPSNTDGGFGIDRSTISNYRLMQLQLLDYRRKPIGFEATNDDIYNISIYVRDKTKAMVDELISSIKKTYGQLREYKKAAEENCAFNNSTENFNTYFKDAVSAQYENNPGEAPWCKAPIVYYMHLDLLYNVFDGDLEEIIKKAAELSLQINPTSGNLQSIENFTNTLNDFINDNYSSIPTMLSTRRVCFVESLTYVGQSGTAEPPETNGDLEIGGAVGDPMNGDVSVDFESSTTSPTETLSY